MLSAPVSEYLRWSANTSLRCTCDNAVEHTEPRPNLAEKRSTYTISERRQIALDFCRNLATPAERI